MPPDPARDEDVRAWLEKAAGDLRAGAHSFAAEPPITFDVSFHAQQACEKALKALLAWHDRPFRKTHNLEEIGEACLALDRTLQEVVDLAVPLSEYAWRFRYPGRSPRPNARRGAGGVGGSPRGIPGSACAPSRSGATIQDRVTYGRFSIPAERD